MKLLTHRPLRMQHKTRYLCGLLAAESEFHRQCHKPRTFPRHS